MKHLLSIDLFKHFLSFFKKKNAKLSDILSKEEELARIIKGGQSTKSVKKLYNPDTKAVNPSQFMDSRNPRELSVNRISTLSLLEAHSLGIAFVEEINSNNPQNKPQKYHGFAKLTVSQCLEAGCVGVVKDDEGGKKPYHANILYPENQKFEDMAIANQLAYFAGKLVEVK